MKTPVQLRATAVVLAGLLLASAAVAVPSGRCCPETRTRETVLRSVDCCAAMLTSPIRQAAAITPARESGHGAWTVLGDTLPAASLLFTAPAPPRALRSPARSAEGPPLFRLNVQLLI